jgi:hypothetical protein
MGDGGLAKKDDSKKALASSKIFFHPCSVTIISNNWHSPFIQRVRRHIKKKHCGLFQYIGYIHENILVSDFDCNKLFYKYELI